MDDKTRQDRRAERLQLLTETSASSDMGRLLRKFWHPIALSQKLECGRARGIRLLNEDLTLYRGESGRPYLVGGRCAHRMTLLRTGWVQGERIRCMYHGWQYDGMGHCVERPAEPDQTDPNIKIPGYPVREYGGLIFAYIGEPPIPDFDLPRKAEFEKPDMLLFARTETWPCNWLQHVENTLDPVHVSFAHQMGRIGAFGQAITTDIPEITYRETEAGICQVAIRANKHVRTSNWTFPNYNHVTHPGLSPEHPWFNLGHWMVPNDDMFTTRAAIWAVPSTNPETDRQITAYFEGCKDFNAADLHHELFDENRYPQDSLIRLTSAQDYVALIGQGAIADRAHEWLGKSDTGVALLRSILWREMESVRLGRPTKHWRRLENPVDLSAEVATIGA